MKHTCSPHNIRRNTGFSVIELMIVLSIASILLMVAIPSFVETTARSAIRTSVNELATELSMARNAAVTRSSSVSLCPSDVSITPQACDNGDWNEGWLTFYDDDGDGTLDAGEILIRIHDALGSRVDITLDNTVTFNSRGMKANVSEFKICRAGNTDAAYARSVVVNVGGLVRGARDTDQDGIFNSGEGGANLSCP
ncbi:GspH/FimT family pseudopilin [Teredinibacter waterburyi]|uniref:GspH/FimT family pseudopilin n=1 Tax=Teredinibacter waterburyi TaxID=1500538 RepID=UPI00165FF774|nr:GspH/FimT family pseudopilin [Teredinibacter waterburyi]